MTLSCPLPTVSAPMLRLGWKEAWVLNNPFKEKDSLGRRRGWGGPPCPFVGEEAQILPVGARNTSGWDPRPSPGAESRDRGESEPETRSLSSLEKMLRGSLFLKLGWVFLLKG